MSDDLTKLEETSEFPEVSSQKSVMANLRAGERWRKSLTDLTLWFMGGVVLTSLVSFVSPGHPILVSSNSIPTGVYWLDSEATFYKAGDYASFPFKPTQDWLRARYGTDRVFTKMIKGVEGDTVYADTQQNLKICHQEPGSPTQCEGVGVPQAVDSLGRPMKAWLAANQHYTLKAGEVWAFGPNPRSLDSRYYGPIRTTSLRGKASPLFIWD